MTVNTIKMQDLMYFIAKYVMEFEESEMRISFMPPFKSWLVPGEYFDDTEEGERHMLQSEWNPLENYYHKEMVFKKLGVAGEISAPLLDLKRLTDLILEKYAELHDDSI